MASLLGSKFPSTKPLGNTGALGKQEEEPLGSSIPSSVALGESNVDTKETPVINEGNFWEDEDDSDVLTGDTEVSFDDEDEDVLGGKPGISENTDDFATFENTLDSIQQALKFMVIPAAYQSNLLVHGNEDGVVSNANKLAYGGVKSLVGAIDLATAPGWAIAQAIPGVETATMPFSKMLEEFYPAKNYTFEDDPDSYVDEALRLSQTTLEFTVPSGPMNLAVKGGSKLLSKVPEVIEGIAIEGAKKVSTAYSPSIASDTAFAAASGFTYQGILEADGGQGLALLGSFIAPMSPQVAKAGWSVSMAAPKTILKLAEQKTILGAAIGPLRKESASVKYAMKAKLEETLKKDPEAWETNWFTRKAKESILKTQDSHSTLQDQIDSITKVHESVHKIIDLENPTIKAHRDKLASIEDMINVGRPEDDKLKLTLEQIYRPVLKDMNDVEGFDTLVDAMRLSNEEAYSENIRKNHRVFADYLSTNSDKLKAEDTEAFMQVFQMHSDDLLKEQENITSLALGMDFTGTSTVTGNPTVYMYPHIPMEESLLKATNEIRTLMTTAYKGMLEKLPSDVELDTTPLKHSIENMYEEMGSLGDPSSVPSYIKSVMKKLMALGEKTEVTDEHKVLLNREAEVTQQVKSLRVDKNTLVAQHKEKLRTINEDLSAAEKKALRVKFQEEYEEALRPIQEARHPLDAELIELTVAKREQRVNSAGDDFASIPEPNYTDLDSVRKALVIVGDELRTAYKSGDQDRITNLSIVHEGLEDTMASLKDYDPKAYELFNAGRSAYKDFYSRDFRESAAGRVTEKKGGHLPKLTSGDAVKAIWVNNDSEGIRRFMTNFDESRNGLKEYVDNIDGTLEDTAETLGADRLSEASATGVKGMQDVIYTHMAEGMRELSLKTYRDPVAQLKDMEDYVAKYLKEHAAKLEAVPGFEKQPQTLRKIVRTLGTYRQQMADIDDQRNLEIIKNIIGPGHTISRVANDVNIAQGLSDFLESMSTAAAKTGDATSAAVASERVRKTMYNALLQQHTNGTKLDTNKLLGLLSRDSDARYNLSMVLGENQMGKLEAQAILAKAIQEGDTKMTEALTQDKWLKAMETHGVSMGRIGSLLSRRAVFTPSAGYIAGAFMSNMIDSMGKKDTSRALKVLFDNPLQLTEMDNFVLQTVDSLTARQQMIIQNGLDTKNLAGVVRLLDRSVAKVIRPYLASLGFQMSEEEIAKVMKDSLMIPEITEEDKPKGKPKEQMEPEFTDEQVRELEESGATPIATERAPTETPALTQPNVSLDTLKTNVPQVEPTDPTNAISTRKSIGEIRNGG